MERTKALAALKMRIETMVARVRSGEMNDTDLRDNTFISMIFQTFPPATTLHRGQYRNLLERYGDRQNDLPEEWQTLGEAPEARIENARGAWVMKEGEHSDIDAWNVLSEVIREVNATSIAEWDPKIAADVGRRLVAALGDASTLKKDRTELLKAIYTAHRSANGATLTSDLSSREKLLEIKEYAGDRMKDTIDLLLKEFALADSEGYEKATKEATVITIKDKAKKGIIRQMMSILGSNALDAAQSNDRLKAILDRYSIHIEGDLFEEAMKAIDGVPQDDDAAQRQAIEAFLVQTLEGAAMNRSAGKLSVDIARRLLGDDYPAMQEEMGRYEFREGAEGGALPCVPEAPSVDEGQECIGRS